MRIQEAPEEEILVEREEAAVGVEIADKEDLTVEATRIHKKKHNQRPYRKSNFWIFLKPRNYLCFFQFNQVAVKKKFVYSQ